jgi:L-threonylcarbamoyladenylate synthase
MKTELFRPENVGGGLLFSLAAEHLRNGELVAFPTETVYGLGANALKADAVRKIFMAKGRPSDNPLIVHIADREDLMGLVLEIPTVAEKLMSCFWPGALTLVFRKSSIVPDVVTAGLDTVAVRMPVHPVALALIRLAGVPVAAPSANRSGRPSPTTAEHVRDDLDGRIPMIVDGGPCLMGMESTVLDVTVHPPMMLRPGAVTREMLESVIGRIEVDPALSGSVDKPKAPGLKYAHYAPHAPMILFTGAQEDVEARIVSEAIERIAQGKRVGLLCTDESMGMYSGAFAQTPGQERIIPLSAGCRAKPSTVAAGVFATLRLFDDLGVDVILSEGFTETGVGHAIMNRLRKAAGGHVIDCGTPRADRSPIAEHPAG